MFFIYLASFAFVLLIIWIRKNQNYFKDQKIPYLKSTPLLGAYKDVLFGWESAYEKVNQIYKLPQFKNEKYFGFFIFHKPALFVKDLDIIKQILTTDFNSFSNRYSSSDTHDPTGYYQLFLVKVPVWKTIRSKLSPFFTSAKLKAAFYLIDKLGKDLNHYVTSRFEGSKNRKEFDIKNLTDYFFVDVISSIAFGIDTHTMENSGGEFYKAAVSIFDCSKTYRGLEFVTIFLMPQLAKLFKFKNFSNLTLNFMGKVMPDVIAERRKSGKRRNDLIDTLLDIEDELVPQHPSHTKEDMMFGQILVFLAAGYETSSSTTSFALYELSKQPEAQQRVRNEIKDALMKNNGKITYEMVANPKELPILHQTVLETLRIYTVVNVLDRECTNSVTIDNGSFTVPKGMPMVIPIFALCRDEKYFENPLKFDIDRFSPENIHKIPPLLTDIAFGTGPRYCIGERLGLIQAKYALITLLKDFRIEANEKTPDEIKFVKKALIIQSETRLLVDFVKDSILQ